MQQGQGVTRRPLKRGEYEFLAGMNAKAAMVKNWPAMTREQTGAGWGNEIDHKLGMSAAPLDHVVAASLRGPFHRADDLGPSQTG
jgi:hypothetical protein